MERLTEKASEGSIQLKKCGNSICMSVCNARSECTECPIDEAFRKLAAYEDLEEQGLLVRLPCPIGTTVWDIVGMDIRENVVSGIEYDKGGKWFLWSNEDEWIGKLNESVFLTREEAEKKLEEMKNND